MRIGQLAKQTGLSRDTIRFYERNGLIASDQGTGTTNNYRDYPEELVTRLKMIREALNAGFSIADLVTLFGAMDSCGEDAEPFEVDAFFDRKIAEIEENIRNANRFLATLKATKQALSLEFRPNPTKK